MPRIEVEGLQLLHDQQRAFTAGGDTLIMRLHSAEGTANETFSSQMNLTVSSITYKWSATEMSEREIRTRLESIGVGVSRYGLVVVLTLIGLLKFTSPEAAGIQPLVAHSPLMSWMYVGTQRSGCLQRDRPY